MQMSFLQQIKFQNQFSKEEKVLHNFMRVNMLAFIATIPLSLLFSISTLPIFFVMSIIAFFMRKKMQNKDSIPAYKQFTRMIKTQYAMLFISVVGFFLFSVINADQIVEMNNVIKNFSEENPNNERVFSDFVSFIIAIVVIPFSIYCVGFFQSIVAWRKLFKNKCKPT